MAKRVKPRPDYAQQVKLAEHLREFEYPDLDTKPNPPTIGGGASVIDVAAHNAPAWEKEGARYLCDGVDDHIVIQTAIEEHVVSSPHKASETTLSSGDFYIDPGWIFVLEQHHLRGQGVFSTRIRHQKPGANDHREALINVQQDGELSDLGFITFDTFEGICVTNNYGIVHDLMHFGHAHCFVFFRGTIHMSSSLDSWANYGADTPEDTGSFGTYASMLAFDEGWHSVANVSFNGRGTGVWVNAFGHATLTGVQITNGLVNVEPDHPSPGVVLADVGGLTLSDVAIRAPFSSAIESQGYSGDVQISNAALYGAYGLSSAPGWGIGWLHMDNVAIQATTSGIEVDDIFELTISGLRIRKVTGGGGVPILPGYGARFSTRLDTRKLAIGDFIIDGFEEDGLLIEPWSGGAGGDYLNIHDGLIENIQKHGMVIEGGRPTVHDVVVKNAGLGAANTYDGFQLKGTMDRPRLHNNDIIGAAQLRYGYNIASAGVVRAIVVGNSGPDPADFGTDAINDQGTDTQLDYPSDATYGDNFFRSGSSPGAGQTEPVIWPSSGPRDVESARPVGVVQGDPPTTIVDAASESESAQAISPVGGASQAEFITLDGDGDSVSTPDSAQLSITGDIEVIICVAADQWDNGLIGANARQTMIGKWVESGNQRSWRFQFAPASGQVRPNFVWSPDGSTSLSFQPGSGPVLVDGTPTWFRFELDVAILSQRGYTAYWSDDPPDTDPALVSWTQIQTFTGGTNTSIFDSTAPVRIGHTVGLESQFAGKVYYAEIRDGIGGTRVANPSFVDGTQADWSLGSGTDDDGNLWTLNGDAVWSG